MSRRCPLCFSDECIEQKTIGKSYWRCDRCFLIYVDAAFLPTAASARDRYLHHQNSSGDKGYVAFLNKAIIAAQPYLSEGMRGLDYGCGPSPILSKLLEKMDVHCENYDPLFFPDLPKAPFDFIFATECFEHFHHPADDIARISSLLKPDGILTVMTDQWTHVPQFDQWYYLRDFTHVSFYHEKTFAYISSTFGYEVLSNDGKRVVVLRKG